MLISEGGKYALLITLFNSLVMTWMPMDKIKDSGKSIETPNKMASTRLLKQCI